ncbi:MAG: hypothetical protein D6761_01085 [Candidatus Dadabacteria bacterium]|nr:MAG: hypothetical protein D6761_01085 [Candidatus Dadabacteria bacterium]
MLSTTRLQYHDAMIGRLTFACRRWLALYCCLLSASCFEQISGRMQNTSGKPDAESLRLSRISDCTSWRKQLIDSWIASQMNTQPYEVLALDGAVADAATEEGAATPDRTSTTNVQEAGVDEADRIETSPDGDLYTISGTSVVRIDAFPPESMTVLASRTLGWAPIGIYYDHDSNTLVAIGQRWSGDGFVDGRSVEADVAIAEDIAPSGSPEVVVTSLDAQSLDILRETTIEGHYIDSRRVGGHLLIVSGFRPSFNGLYEHQNVLDLADRLRTAAWEDANSAETRRLRERLRTELDGILPPADAPQLRPTTWQDGEVRQRLACDAISAPRSVDVFPSLVMVTSMDLRGEQIEQAGVLNEAWLVYATADNLYLIQSSGGWWWFGNQHPQQTAIWRFSIDNDTPTYEAAGVVDGWLSDRYQISERDGYLRLFTTGVPENGGNDARLSSSLYVLPIDENPMTVAAAITGIAPGEQIFAARYVDDRAFLVTFRQIDPLFAFDLSDPLNPQLVGELTIPGFSTYMHPLDGDLLLTIGRDGDDTGNVGGVAVQLFDVADLSAPRQVTRFVPADTNGWDWSPASYDPHAFLYDAPTGTLAFPWSYYDYDTDNGFAGVLVIDVDPTAGTLSERGRIDHAALARPALCNGECEPYIWWWPAFPQRSALMASGNNAWLYTVSELAVIASPVERPADTAGSVLLPWNP